jgi:pyruvate/2-oxoacid:ferredoxin oxidoreductase beta subunit
VHDNQIYGLTKGQPSPTTAEGTTAKNTPFGVISGQFNPMALAVALDCSFAARAYAADTEHLKGLMKEAMNHKGFALIDILQRASRSTSSTPADGIASASTASSRSMIRKTGQRPFKRRSNGAIKFRSA